MKTKYVFFLIVIVMLVYGCATTHKPSKSNNLKPHNTMKEQVAGQSKMLENPQFIILQGNFNVILSDTINTPILLRDQTLLNHIEVTKTNNSLSITEVNTLLFSDPIDLAINAKDLEALQFIGKGVVRSKVKKVQPIDLEITTNSSIVFEDLLDSRYLNLEGSGEVIFKKLKTDYLVINASGGVKVNIEGKINLQYLNITDHAKIILHRIDSPFTRVIAKGSSYVELAGVAKILELVLQDRAKFNGDSLRVDKVFANTTANTKADINAKNVRNISASGESKVYNHRNTTMKNDNVGMHSSVLDAVH